MWLFAVWQVAVLAQLKHSNIVSYLESIEGENILFAFQWYHLSSEQSGITVMDCGRQNCQYSVGSMLN